MANILDVARAAGVSKATVSHVLNGTRRVRDETKARVLRAAAALDYHPSNVARGLSTRSTRTIGVIVADITNPFFATVVRGIEDALSEAGYSLIVCNTDESVTREARALRMLLGQRVDGLIIAPTGRPQDAFESLTRLGVPTAFIDRVPPRRAGPLIAIDNVQAGRDAAAHLVALGHRRIGMIAREPGLSTVTGRLLGYRQLLEEHGVALDPALTRTVPSTLGAATAAAMDLLAGPGRPTALIAGNHVMALGVLHAIRQLGVACPDEVSVVAFDDHAFAPLLTPPLTVMRMPVDEICTSAARTVLRAVAGRTDGGESPAASAPDVVLRAALVVRSSTAPPPEARP